ncbi:MAG: bifunctional homocysteine S-methyltransferase/methylenetetrahydrofolate reductase [Candidatus Sericytochromatia bacterium]|nr:bifunctional homocysteine S-methyltransferase/methylenetetrahydrofolate reductase [Candidatus Tanganyikabacteria bacterium]
MTHRLNFRELLATDRVLLFDGAMGTMLYQKGVFLNRCFDELVLAQPDLVREVHQEYARAGAEILETNTFGANRAKLAGFGLVDKVADINRRAAELAREAGGADRFVAGAVGPLGLRLEPYGPTSFSEARELFGEQIRGLVAGGADLIVLETFSDLLEIEQALLAAREACDLPVVAQMTVGEDGATAYGAPADLIARKLDAWGADVIGLNCSVGPAKLLEAVESMRESTARPLSVQPNAGLPREVDGRKIYLSSPEYHATYAKLLVQSGVRFVGGCCGTTPEHIEAMRDAIRSALPRQAAAVAIRPVEPPPEVAIVPVADRSHFARRLADRAFVTTVEIVPPRGCDAAKMLEGVRQLRDAGVDSVNVPDGPRAQSRMGAIATGVLIEREGIEAVVHYTCRDRNLLGMMSDLLGAAALGLRNLLLVTGDPPKMGPYPSATAVFDIDAIGLTNMVSHLNSGLDLGGNPIGRPTEFLVGVGVNPCAIDPELELSRYRWKVEAGAHFAITQPVFDPEQLERFLESASSHRIPVVAGIWPLVSQRNAEFMANEVPGVVVPRAIIERMRRRESRDDQLAEGLEIAREMLARVKALVQGVQVSAPFGRVSLALEVLEGCLPARAADPGELRRTPV